VHCFSIQVVINKCFLLNPKKNLAQIRLVVFEKNAPLIPKNDVTEPKARLLQVKVSFRLPKTMVSENLETDF